MRRLSPRSIGGRVLVATAATLVAIVVSLALLLPVVLQGYGSGPEDTTLGAIGARLISAIVVAAVVSAVVAFVAAGAVGADLARPMEALADRATAENVSARGWSVDGAPIEIERLAAALRRTATGASERQAVAEAQRDRMATLLREMADAVLIVDGGDRIQLANPAADRLLGVHDLVGRALAEVARDHEILDAVTAARRSGAATGEIERMDPRRTVRVVARSLPGGDVLLAAQDLTMLRRLETVRRDFVANVSHELRTPIASLKAMAEALEGGAIDDPGAARDFVGRMHREIDELAQLVAELMTLTRVESGAERVDLAAVRPSEIVASASRLQPLAERAGVNLEVSLPSALPIVTADLERIGQVLSNLVHNAVKFTPPGGHITVSAERAPDSVRFLVRDTGVGIPREDLDRIFERFYKGERSRAGAGTGLGLAIARHIVNAHGGTITAESDGPGRGSTFSFTLPVAEAGVRA